jgi:hypothetical protein
MRLPLTVFLNKLYKSLIADKESDTDRFGYASYRAELHAIGWGFSSGFYAGFTGQYNSLTVSVGWLLTRSADKKMPGYIPWGRDLVKESGYVVTHAIVGLISGLLIKSMIQ